jgi:Ni/Co efflux regulator RcnB
MRKYFVTLLLAAIAGVSPAAFASERAAYVPAVYNSAEGSEFQLVGHRHKKKHHRHNSHRNRRSHSGHRHPSHYSSGHHHDSYYRPRRDTYISVPGLGSFRYSR